MRAVFLDYDTVSAGDLDTSSLTRVMPGLQLDVYKRQPLPRGLMRVSQLDPADHGLEFIGEDVIDHTPKNERVLVKLGSSFDVVGERRQVDFSLDSKAKWMEEEIEIKAVSYTHLR